MQREAARNGGDAKESKEEPKDSKSDKDPPLSEQSSTQLKKKLLSYTEEFHMASGANIPGTALAAGTVPASAIVPNSITDAQLTDGAFITNKANFLVGASTWEQSFSNNDTDYTLGVGTETVMISPCLVSTRPSCSPLRARLV